MCNCKNVYFGEYEKMVTMAAPWDTTDKKYKSIDKCIIDEIGYLWENGIVTSASCCGHNLFCGAVIVEDSCIEKMNSFGYIRIENLIVGGAKWLYLCRSIPIVPLAVETEYLRSIKNPYIDRHVRFKAQAMHEICAKYGDENNYLMKFGRHHEKYRV